MTTIADRRSLLLTFLAGLATGVGTSPAPLALVADQLLRADDSKPSNVGDAAVQKVQLRRFFERKGITDDLREFDIQASPSSAWTASATAFAPS